MIEEGAHQTPSEDLEVGNVNHDLERPAPDQPADDDLVMEDLLVEEVSIDGMCGVY